MMLSATSVRVLGVVGMKPSTQTSCVVGEDIFTSITVRQLPRQRAEEEALRPQPLDSEPWAPTRAGLAKEPRQGQRQKPLPRAVAKEAVKLGLKPKPRQEQVGVLSASGQKDIVLLAKLRKRIPTRRTIRKKTVSTKRGTMKKKPKVTNRPKTKKNNRKSQRR